mgnify:FL=1
MKESPDLARLEELLRSSRLSASGFLGTDPRPLQEIIDTDAALIDELGLSKKQVATRMREITDAAKTGLEMTVDVNDAVEAYVYETRGRIVCPWPHPGAYDKTVTVARRKDKDVQARWSDLNIHMIEAHGFFEGRGSPFRLEPTVLAEILFS